MYCKIAHLMKLPPLSDIGILERVVANFQCFLRTSFRGGLKDTHFTRNQKIMFDKEFLKICSQQPHMTVW